MLTAVTNPPGSATDAVKAGTPPAGVPTGGLITSRSARRSTQPGAPLIAVMVSASASEARSVTGIVTASPRKMLTNFGCATGSWLTSIVIRPFARRRHELTTE